MDQLLPIWEWLITKASWVWDIFTTPIFTLGKSGISIGTILYVSIAFTLLFVLTRRLKHILIARITEKTTLSKGSVVSMGTIFRFVVIMVGSIIILQSAGIDISTIGLIAGGLGIGIGFGLQNITDNFISGIVILFEKPIKVGDRIEIGDIEGDVINIAVRATTIQTNDNISIIVPNSQFISSQVINWSHNDRSIRYRIPVGVSYNEDPDQIRSILLAVANDSPHVLKEPIPMVLFTEYGDSSLNFELAVWTQTHTDKPKILKSELYFEIFSRFKKQSIEIPFPQRDLHIRSSDVSF